MDEILPATTDGPHARSKIVPFVDRSSDSGTSWARSLSASSIADLVDYAGKLAYLVPILNGRKMTKKRFELILRRKDCLEEAHTRLARIVGYAGSQVEPYYVWWAYAWVYNYTRFATDFDDDREAKEHTAGRLGTDMSKVEYILVRRDVSYMVSLFLARSAREMQGEVAWRTTKSALEGGSRAQELFYKHVMKESDVAESGTILDPFDIPTNELMADIERMRKEAGIVPTLDVPMQPVEEDADVEVKRDE